MKNINAGFLTLSFAFCLSLPLQAAKVDAAAIVQHGNAKGAMACMICHGRNGQGNAAAGYPYLAGTSANYLKSQLQAFRNGSRTNPIMQPIASKLSEDEVTALARYFASLKPPKQQTGADSKYPKGAALANMGKWSSGVPSCFKCHGEAGKGVAPHFPPIAGQSFVYIKNQLQAWQSGKRKNDPLGLMQSVAGSLDEQDIEQVAHYLSAQ